ncbi:MAG: hypothetical protein AVDCRST_MAG73-2530 [uncultured Thermomicrobiales bacterium]|uniref:Uncharacterized protein n=1 Tax=uncultured Thermomicrobiales bacterium TaxID=1645740 RepID=A0A6J4UD29_9BACT|nr:MAG: hypothetical protein AVDCRST_MAG73-2530 [uncultured Thermomicrobiales bacterium]
MLRVSDAEIGRDAVVRAQGADANAAVPSLADLCLDLGDHPRPAHGLSSPATGRRDPPPADRSSLDRRPTPTGAVGPDAPTGSR